MRFVFHVKMKNFLKKLFLPTKKNMNRSLAQEKKFFTSKRPKKKVFFHLWKVFVCAKCVSDFFCVYSHENRFCKSFRFDCWNASDMLNNMVSNGIGIVHTKNRQMSKYSKSSHTTAHSCCYFVEFTTTWEKKIIL